LEEVAKAGGAAIVTRQLLAFTGSRLLNPRLLDLNAVISDVQEMLRRLIGVQVAIVFRPGAGPRTGARRSRSDRPGAPEPDS